MTKVTGATYSVSFGNSECSFTTDGTTPTLTGGKLTLESSVTVDGKFTTQQPTLTINALTSAGGTNLLGSNDVEWGVYTDEAGTNKAADKVEAEWYAKKNLTGWGSTVTCAQDGQSATIAVDPLADAGTYYLVAKAKTGVTTVTGSIAGSFTVSHAGSKLESIKLLNGQNEVHSNDTLTVNGTDDIVLTVKGVDQFGNDSYSGWTLEQSGVSAGTAAVTADGSAKTVTIDKKSPAASNVEITITDSTDNTKTAKKGFNITRADSEAKNAVFYKGTSGSAEKITASKQVSGETVYTDTVNIPGSASTDAVYTYKLIDQFDAEITPSSVTWTTEPPDLTGTGVTFSNGTLKVANNCTLDKITLSATAKATAGESVTKKLEVSLIALTFKSSSNSALSESDFAKKDAPTYGDTWEQIVTIPGGIKVYQGETELTAAEGASFTFSVVGADGKAAPDAGTNVGYVVKFTGAGYENLTVFTGRVNEIAALNVASTASVKLLSGTTDLTSDGIAAYTNTLTYTGDAQVPDVEVKKSSGASADTFSGTDDYETKIYVKGDDKKALVSPVNAGEYAVDVTFKGNYQGTVTKYFKIAPKALTLTWPTSTSFTYGDSYSATATPTNAVAGDVIQLEYTYAGRDGTAYETIATAPTDVGKYTVTAALAEAASGNANANYTLEGVTNTTCDFEITKAANTIAWTAASYTYVYGSDSVLPQATADSGAAAVKYYTNEECTSELASTTALDAGTYYAKATAEGTNNYQSATAITTTFTVTKAVYAGTGDTVESIYVPTLASKDRSYIVTAEAFTCLADVNGFKDWFVKNPTIGTNTSGLLGTTVSVDSNDKKTIHYTTHASNVDDTATITFKIESKNYQDVSATLTLTAKSIVLKMDGSTNLTFAGVSAVAGKAYGAKDSELVTITGTAAVALDAMGNEVSGTIAAKTPNNVQSVNENGNTVIVEFTAGTGEYEGATIEYEVPVTIAPKAVTLEWSDEELTFNGQPQSKISTIGGYVGEETGLVVETYSYAGSAGTEYQQSATKPTNAGTYTVTATALKADAGATANAANYRLPDDASTTFTISPRTLTAADIEVSAEETEFTYDGTAKVPQSFTVTNVIEDGNDLTLTANDYEVAWSNNVSVRRDGTDADGVLPTGTATLTLKGNFRAEDTIAKSGIFVINPKNVSGITTFTVSNREYTGSALNNGLTVTVQDTVDGNLSDLTSSDYSIGYKLTKNTSVTEVKNVGRYTATITGKGNYTGTRDTTFEVTGKAVNAAVITLYAPTDTSMTTPITSLPYTGGPIMPLVKVEVEGATLESGTDYTVAYSGNVNASTETAKAKVIVTFRGNYANGVEENGGTKVFATEFTIAKAPISGFTVSYNNGAEGELTYAYDGKAHAPAVKVSKTESGITTTLRNGTDYTVTLKKDQNDLTAAPINVGTYTVTVAAKDGGNYTGSFEPKTFTITPAAITPTINGLPTGMVYDGAAKTVTPTVTATLNSANITLVEGTDYTIAYTYAAFGADGDETATDAQYSSASAIQNAGSYKATVTLAEGGNYALVEGATNTATFSVARAPRTIKLRNSLTISAGQTGGQIRVVEDNATDKEASEAYTFTSADESVTITQSENVATAKRAEASSGAVTITVNAKRTQNYGTATATIPVTFVADTVQILTPPSAPVLTVEYGRTDAANQYTTNAAGNTITYASSNTGVATVDSNGAITTVGVGTTTITVSAPEKNAFAAATTRYQLTVTAKKIAPVWKLQEGDAASATIFAHTSGVYETAAYDGKDKVVSAEITGVVSGDTVNITGTKTVKNAGSYEFTVSLTGADAAKYQLSTDTLNFVVPKATRSGVTLTAGAETLASSFTLTPADNASGNAKITNGVANLTIDYTGKNNPADANLVVTSSDPSALTMNAAGELTVKKNFTDVTLTFKLAESVNYEAMNAVTYTVSKGVINPVTAPTTALASDAKSTVSVAFENGKIVISGLVASDALPSGEKPIVIKDESDNTIALALTETVGADGVKTYRVDSVTLRNSGSTGIPDINGFTAEQIKALIDVSGLSAAPTTVKVEVGKNLVVEAKKDETTVNIIEGVNNTSEITDAMVNTINDVTSGVSAGTDELLSALTSVISDVDNKDSKSNTVNNTLKVKVEAIQAAAGSETDKATAMKTLATNAGINEKEFVYEQNNPTGSWITEDNFAIVMEPSIKVEPKEFKFDNGGAVTSFKLEIKPQFTIFAREKDNNGEVIVNGSVTQLTAPQPVNSRDLKNEIPVTVSLPAGFSAVNLFAAHYPDGSSTPDRYYRTTDNGDGTVTFNSKDFSPYEFVMDTASATVTYHYADGTTNDTTYDKSDVNVTLLPVDDTVAAHQTWNGWSIVDENSSTIYKPNGNSDKLSETTDTSSVFSLKTLDKENKALSPVHIYSRYETSRVSTPTISISGGTVTISTTTDGATIYYTTDGTTPTTGSTAYGGTVSVTSGTTVKAIAVKALWLDSEVASQTYTSGGGSNTGSSGTSAATVSTAQGVTGGTVKYSNANAKAGDKVTITPTADAGYRVASITVKDGKGNVIPVTANADGTYTFTMPNGAVTVTPVFEKAPASAQFTDVVVGSFYEAAVKWAVSKGITDGTSATTFSPDAPCTRAQAVTFLYRAAGEPEVTLGTSFTDVKAGSYYEKAVAWALAKGITDGTSATTFSPDAACTRAQIVTFLARYEKAAAVSSDRFTDVAADTYYAGAVGWAAANGITDGTSATKFSPEATCTRAQIVTFLYRDFVK